MNRKLIQIAALLILMSCKTIEKKHNQTGISHESENNSVIYGNIDSTNNKAGKIVFLGRNNEVKINDKNFQDKSINNQKTLIISGDNNKIELNLFDIKDNSVNSHDTTALVGNSNQLNIKQQRIIDNSISSDKNRIIFANGRNIDLSDVDLLDDSKLSELEYAIIVEDTLQVETYYKAERIYLNKARKGNPKSQFLLAKIYEFQGRCTESTKFLKLSADQSYLDAIIHLADLYCYGSCKNEINKIEALKFYKKAALLGNEYAKSMVTWLE